MCLLVVMSGCFGPPSPSSTESTTTASSSTSDSSATASPDDPNDPPTAAPLPGPGDGPPPAAGAPVIRWVPIGPAAPSDPPEGALYEFLRKRDCAGLRDSTLNTGFPAVWTAAEATCQALATDLPVDWERAQTALADVTGLPPGRCWEIKVTASLQQAVDLRNAHQGVQLLVDAAGAGDDCPRRLTGLTVLAGPHAGAAAPTVPAGGGTPVRLEGFFVNVDNVLVSGNPVEFEGPQFGPFVFYAPPANGIESARVTVEATPPVSGEAVLFFAGPTPPGPTPTEPTTTAPPEPPGTGLPTVGPPAAEAPPAPQP
ncbi:hypothetical protein [Arthrobacter oryzae]|uniref:hypothetical protein n=1 Tax=Arthrobacter oryzae TaxID=409290 RepID=UPI00273ACF10|nr:hypothetical protein [Arthrobacter oryzae]WLQ06009.1 hypothetical protein Q8Z05_18245 [Arthrobacter oryzae]